jgi:hypothetical protein
MVCARTTCGTVFCDDDDYLPDGDGHRRRYCSARCADSAYHLRKREARRRRERAGDTACKTPHKRRWATSAEADSAASSVADGIPLYPYLCRCGSWHLSKQERVEDPAGRPA